MDLQNKSVAKAFEIIESFEKAGKRHLTISELSEITDISISTAYRMASSLVHLGYLNRNEPDKTYSLGWKFVRLLSTMSDIVESLLINRGGIFVKRLSERFNENASLYVRLADQRLCLFRVEGSQEVRNVVKAGSINVLVSGSPGKVLLAHLPEETWGQYFDPADTALAETLRTIRAQGYATTVAEITAGASSISAPVFDERGEVIAALTLSGPSFRFGCDTFQEKLAAVIEHAGLITAAMQHSFPGENDPSTPQTDS
ncbi:MAG: IclR family transcriptional regulator [Rhodospirillaceae bacterium]